MGKETKEMLKTINSNLELIMKHLKIVQPEPVSSKNNAIKVNKKKATTGNGQAVSKAGKKK